MISRNIVLMLACNDYIKCEKFTAVRIEEIKYGNSLSPFFDKNFVKATFLLKKLLNNWFHEFLLRNRVFVVVSTLCVSNLKFFWKISYVDFTSFFNEIKGPGRREIFNFTEKMHKKTSSIEKINFTKVLQV